MSFEKFIIPLEDEPKMPINTFQSILVQFIAGDITTGAEAKAIIETVLTDNSDIGPITLTTDEQTDVTETVSWVTAPSGLENKLARMHRIFAIFELAEIGAVNTTQAELRTKMQSIISGWTTPS